MSDIPVREDTEESSQSFVVSFANMHAFTRADIPVNPHSIHNMPKYYDYSILPQNLRIQQEEKERLPPTQPANPGSGDLGAVSSPSSIDTHNNNIYRRIVLIKFCYNRPIAYVKSMNCNLC
jgi:hypothetical protein